MCVGRTNGRSHSFVLDFSFVSFLCIKTKKRKELKKILYWLEERRNITDNRAISLYLFYIIKPGCIIIEYILFLFFSKEWSILYIFNGKRYSILPGHLIGAIHNSLYITCVNQRFKVTIKICHWSYPVDCTYISIHLWINI